MENANEYLRFLSLEEKLLWLGTICKKQSIALEILYRSISLIIHLISTVQATEVTKGE